MEHLRKEVSSAERMNRANVPVNQETAFPENGWRVPEQITNHVLESPDELADFTMKHPLLWTRYLGIAPPYPQK